MSPSEQLVELVTATEEAVADLAEAAGQSESLARHATRDELRFAAEALSAHADAVQSLLDWVEVSDLPPGLRGAVEQVELAELDPGGARVGAPGDTSSPLPALLYTDVSEGLDDVLVDVADMPPGDYVPGALEPRRDDRVYPDRPLVRLRGMRPLGDTEVDPEEPAAFYFDAAGARRAAAQLRQGAARAQRR